MALSNVLRKLHLIRPLPKKEGININKDSKAIIDFLLNLTYDQEHLLRLFKKFLELRLEYHTLADDSLKLMNLTHQINMFNQIIQSYSFFQGDADINGKRVKNIAKSLKTAAAKSGNQNLIDTTSKLNWKFDW